MNLPHTTPDQREILYEDVESLLSVGFLSHPVSIGGTDLCLRSLNPGDLFMLRSRVSNNIERSWQTWALASAIWMINGYSLLGEVHAPPRLKATVDGLPRITREILFTLLLGLFSRQTKALRTVEGYCYEGISRYRWRTYGGQYHVVSAGFPGAASLGTNHVQQMWVAFNVLEDLREQEETQWGGFKLVASATSPKGVQKIEAKDKQRKEEESRRRQSVMDKVFYQAAGLLNDEGKPVGEAKGAKIQGPSSPAELVEDMRKWVVGEEDEHDRRVTAYKREISLRYEAAKKEKELRRQQLLAVQEAREESGVGPSIMVGYTQEQLQEILQDRQPGAAGVRMVNQGEGQVREYLYEKYLERAPDAGKLVVAGDELVVAERVNRPLEQVLEGRKVPFQGSEE